MKTENAVERKQASKSDTYELLFRVGNRSPFQVATSIESLSLSECRNLFVHRRQNRLAKIRFEWEALPDESDPIEAVAFFEALADKSLIDMRYVETSPLHRMRNETVFSGRVTSFIRDTPEPIIVSRNQVNRLHHVVNVSLEIGEPTFLANVDS